VSGEFELIAAIRERLAAGGAASGSARVVLGSGDDAAIVAGRAATATSVDMLVEGVHFEAPPFAMREVGAKALAVALSDLAAMGATPAEAYVQLGAPADRSDAELLELAEGLGAVASTYGIVVAGGDLSEAPALVVAVTVVGEASAPEALVRRSGAQAGDVVAVTGELGGAAAGLLVLQRPELAAGLDPGVAAALRARQVEPVPRVDAGRSLAALGATAMIDVSDGLAADAGHLADSSGGGVEIDTQRLPVAAGVAEVAVAAGLDELELVAAGGEDYELLATLPAEAFEPARAAVAEHRLALTAIGRVVDGTGIRLSGPDGPVTVRAGFDQRPPRPGRPDTA
jgi:thiamine-monophosphate kinase